MDEQDPDEATIQRRRRTAATSMGCFGEALGCALPLSLVLVFLLPFGLMHWM